MSGFGAAWRLAVLGLVCLGLAPLQSLAIRRGWRLAGRLPVFVHRVFVRLFGLRLTVRGAPPGGGPTLVLANHVSWLDIPVIGSLCPLSFIAKSEVAGWPVAGQLARWQRSVFIERARRGATAEVNALVAARLGRGETVVLFAEGTTGDGNRLLPFRSSLIGAARAALGGPGLAEVWLQPLTIAYTSRNGLPVTRRDRPEIAWYGDMDLLPHAGALLRSGPLDVVVVWGEPIPFGASSDRKAATQRSEAAVRRALRDLARAQSA